MKSSQFFCLILICSTFSQIHGKIPSFDDDDDQDEPEKLVSKKKFTANPGDCAAAGGKCPDEDSAGMDKSGMNKNAIPVSAAPQMMDQTTSVVIDTMMKYFKQFTEGKLDIKKILSPEYVQKIVKLFMMAKLPGGNAALSGGLDLMTKFMKQVTNMEKQVKKDGVDFKGTLEKVQAAFSEVVPGLIIALQHADNACQIRSLCQSARLSGQSKQELSKSVNMFLTNAAGSFLDFTGKKKKGDYMKCVECCSSDDKAIYTKCSKKYLDEEACPTATLNDGNRLKPIDLKHFEFIKDFLPKF